MKEERWRQVERLYHSTLAKQPSERSAFLAETCAGDEELRQEVESLLSYEDRAENFIESPALDVAARLMAQDDSRDLDAELSPQRGGGVVAELMWMEAVAPSPPVPRLFGDSRRRRKSPRGRSVESASVARGGVVIAHPAGRLRGVGLLVRPAMGRRRRRPEPDRVARAD